MAIASGVRVGHWGVMEQNRIRALREARGIDIKLLARDIGVDPSTLSKTERGLLGLSMHRAKKIAAALGVTVFEVYGMPGVPGSNGSLNTIADDVEPYEVTAGDLLAGTVTVDAELQAFRMMTESLSELKISPGDVLVARRRGRLSLNEIKPLQIVVANVPNLQDPGRQNVVARQFVPPALLITNSAASNALPINIGAEEADIQGIVISVHRPLP